MTVNETDMAQKVREQIAYMNALACDIGRGEPISPEFVARKIVRLADTLQSLLDERDKTRMCYCEIGAGGNPCVSREHCDKFRELQAENERLREERNNFRDAHDAVQEIAGKQVARIEKLEADNAQLSAEGSVLREVADCAIALLNYRDESDRMNLEAELDNALCKLDAATTAIYADSASTRREQE